MFSTTSQFPPSKLKFNSLLFSLFQFFNLYFHLGANASYNHVWHVLIVPECCLFVTGKTACNVVKWMLSISNSNIGWIGFVSFYNIQNFPIKNGRISQLECVFLLCKWWFVGKKTNYQQNLIWNPINIIIIFNKS